MITMGHGKNLVTGSEEVSQVRLWKLSERSSVAIVEEHMHDIPIACIAAKFCAPEIFRESPSVHVHRLSDSIGTDSGIAEFIVYRN